MESIGAIARGLGIEPKHLVPYGDDKAKVSLDAIRAGAPKGKLVVVTGMTPTAAAEGKTTVAIGLTEALARRRHKAAVTLREPALGRVFGGKGGGTGGGWATVVPEEDISLHFTGDSHAVASAHNLLAALTENAVRRRQVEGLTPEDIVWRRVTTMEDRALRHIATGLGGEPNGPVRETGFDLTEASEVMAVLALATGYDNLRRRLGAITVGYTQDDRPVRAGEIGAVGSMMALLKDAILPNLVQTGGGQPAFVHTGPFANIAHGCSSVVADRLALGYADYVVTECGFGADLGFEKFMHIKVRSSGLRPAAAVLVATVRAVKSHGGVPDNALTRPDAFAARIGASNLEHMVKLVRAFGLPVVVAINMFATDTAEEVLILQDVAINAGASAAVTCSAFNDGASGAAELAEAVERVATGEAKPRYMYPEDASLREKIVAVATKVYGATGVRLTQKADERLTFHEERGLGGLPICMAKTPFSLSHDPSLKNRPTQFTLEVSDAGASTGAGFVQPIAGDLTTMPGLPRHPRALDVDKSGRVTGL